MHTLALTELLGARVLDAGGAVGGWVREVAVAPQDDPDHVAALVVRTRSGDRVLAAQAVEMLEGRAVRTRLPQAEWPLYASSEGLLLLGRDLLDQQIIDVHGRKLVRVNDAELVEERTNSHLAIKVAAVDVGARGALRRLLKGLLPASWLRRLVSRIPAKSIPWDFVDLIETDPSRRVKLKISLEGLATMHPAEIADIVEELAPAEREAVFETLDEEVAAETLEEVNPKLQASIVSSLDSDKAADIVEEMNPDAAADLLGDLSPEQQEEILEEMEPAERDEVTELLSHGENTAAGRMTTEFLALPPEATVGEAHAQLRRFEGEIEGVSSVFLTDAAGKLLGAVPLARLLLAAPTEPLKNLSVERVISCGESTSQREVAETFDKYNLLSLPVVDDSGVLTGVITADDVISLLRSKI